MFAPPSFWGMGLRFLSDSSCFRSRFSFFSLRVSGVLLFLLIPDFTLAKVAEPTVRVRTVLSNFHLQSELQKLGDHPGPRSRIGQHEVHGIKKVQVRSRSQKTSEVVLHIHRENYLKVVIPSEMPQSWPLEALKAQAVASRSYVEARRLNRSSADWDVESTIADQVFDLRKSRAIEDLPPNLIKAVEETAGQLLVDDRGQIQQAYFHSDCGGQTERAFFAWGVKDGTQSVRDLSCPTTPAGRWRLELTREELSLALGYPVEGLRLISQSPAGRVTRLMVKKPAGESVLLGGERLRQLVGFERLKSTRFKVQATPSGYRFEGLGFGHGVGMCQWGARALALQGKNHLEILAHYYPQWQVRGPEARVAARDSAGPRIAP